MDERYPAENEEDENDYYGKRELVKATLVL
jgi:hypothetical protein